jgi:hypothetical protein
VFASVARNGFVPTPIPHFAAKHEIEAHIIDAARETHWTFLQPVAFMENMLSGGVATRAFFTTLEYYLGQRPLPYVATEDIGKFAARVLAVRVLLTPPYWHFELTRTQDPTQYHGKSVVLAGDNLSIRDVQRIYSAHSGANGATLPRFVGHLAGAAVPKIGKMMKWMRDTVRAGSLAWHSVALTSLLGMAGIPCRHCCANETRLPRCDGPRDLGEAGAVCAQVRSWACGWAHDLYCTRYPTSNVRKTGLKHCSSTWPCVHASSKS